ncbi:hypothetical protein ANCDUO_21403, partial [Ancylostoma duodenale]
MLIDLRNVPFTDELFSKKTSILQEEKLRRAQEGRKQSLWQRVYKVAREQAQQRKVRPKVKQVDWWSSQIYQT